MLIDELVVSLKVKAQIDGRVLRRRCEGGAKDVQRK